MLVYCVQLVCDWACDERRMGKFVTSHEQICDMSTLTYKTVAFVTCDLTKTNVK